MQPYMVQKITDAAGRTVQEFSPTVRRRVISEQTSATMRELRNTPSRTATAKMPP